MTKLLSVHDKHHVDLTSRSLRATIGPLQNKAYSHYVIGISGILPYRHLTITRDFFRLYNTLARLYNAAASPASRLRSAGSLAKMCLDTFTIEVCKLHCINIDILFTIKIPLITFFIHSQGKFLPLSPTLQSY